MEQKKSVVDMFESEKSSVEKALEQSHREKSGDVVESIGNGSGRVDVVKDSSWATSFGMYGDEDESPNAFDATNKETSNDTEKSSENDVCREKETDDGNCLQTCVLNCGWQKADDLIHPTTDDLMHPTTDNLVHPTTDDIMHPTMVDRKDDVTDDRIDDVNTLKMDETELKDQSADAREDDLCNRDNESSKRQNDKNRNRSRSNEDRRHRKRSKEEGSSTSTSREPSSRRRDTEKRQKDGAGSSRERVGFRKNDSSPSRDENRNSSDRKERHDRRTKEKGDVDEWRSKSPVTKDDFDDSEVMNSKRRRSYSNEKNKDTTSSRKKSDRYNYRRKSKSRSRSKGKYDRYHRKSYDYEKKKRSRSKEDYERSSCKDGRRNRSRSRSRNNAGTSEKRRGSRSRDNEATGKGWTSTSDDREKRSESEIGSKYRKNHEERDPERRTSRSKDEDKSHSYSGNDIERTFDGSYSKQTRSRSRSAEKSAWNSSSNWSERKRYRDNYHSTRDDSKEPNDWSNHLRERFSEEYSSRGRGGLRSSWQHRGRGGHSYSNRHYDERCMDAGDDPQRWNRNEKSDWNDYSLNQRNKNEKKDTNVKDDGVEEKWEDIVTKSIAKIRHDSDRLDYDDASAAVETTSKDRDRGTEPSRVDDQVSFVTDSSSSITVLLSKKSSFKNEDSYDPLEPTDFQYNQDSNDCFTAARDDTLLARHQTHPGRPHAAAPPRLPPHSGFHGNFREHPPTMIDFRPRMRHMRIEGERMMRFPPQFSIVHQQRLPPRMVGPGVILGPFPMQQPPQFQEIRVPVEWRIVGPDARIPLPPPSHHAMGQRAGGFMRIGPPPVEFMAHPSQRPGCLSVDPRQIHPMMPVHRLELPQRMIEVRHLGPPPPPLGLQPHPHPHPHSHHQQQPVSGNLSQSLAYPPPPLPASVATGNNSHGVYSVAGSSSQMMGGGGRGPADHRSLETPPPPPPPSVMTTASNQLDPRLRSSFGGKPTASEAMPRDDSPGSTSSESVDSITNKRHQTSQRRWSKDDVNDMRQSTSSVGSIYTSQEVTTDAYTDALFEEPFHRRIEVDAASNVRDDSTATGVAVVVGSFPMSTTSKLESAVLSQSRLNDDVEIIPEIVNPMESPTVDDHGLNCGSRSMSLIPEASFGDLAVQALKFCQVSELKKVLENIRTTSSSAETNNVDLTKQEEKTAVSEPNRMEEIAEEVKAALKPHFGKGLINKDEYKDIMRRAVPKIFSSKTGVDPMRIAAFVEVYVNKIVRAKKNEKAKKSTSGQKRL